VCLVDGTPSLFLPFSEADPPLNHLNPFINVFKHLPPVHASCVEDEGSEFLSFGPILADRQQFVREFGEGKWDKEAARQGHCVDANYQGDNTSHEDIAANPSFDGHCFVQVLHSFCPRASGDGL
jgi:hypothetical protein